MTLTEKKIGRIKYMEILEYNRSYRKNNNLRANKWKRNECHRVKIRCFDLYGGVCCKCGFSDSRALQIDHIDGVPFGLRRISNNPHRGGIKLYRAIIANKYPKDDFQLLCSNCNWIKRFENKEHLNYNLKKESHAC